MDIDNNGYISEENFLRKIEITCFPSAIAIAQLDHQGGIFMIGKLGAWKVCSFGNGSGSNICAFAPNLLINTLYDLSNSAVPTLRKYKIVSTFVNVICACFFTKTPWGDSSPHYYNASDVTVQYYSPNIFIKYEGGISKNN